VVWVPLREGKETSLSFISILLSTLLPRTAEPLGGEVVKSWLQLCMRRDRQGSGEKNVEETSARTSGVDIRARAERPVYQYRLNAFLPGCEQRPGGKRSKGRCGKNSASPSARERRGRRNVAKSRSPSVRRGGGGNFRKWVQEGEAKGGCCKERASS